MRLNAKKPPARWMDRTMTVLRTGRLEACEKEFAGLGGRGLFDPETTDAEAETLFEQSYYRAEEPAPRLHTLEELRVRVLGCFPAELTMLSEEELRLLGRMILFGGETRLFNWEELIPALSLVKRMWCRAVPDKGNCIRIPLQLGASAVLLMASDEFTAAQENKKQILERADNSLYLAGMIPADAVMADLEAGMRDTLAAGQSTLWSRFLQASFETIRDRKGRLMLVHPGLADPWKLLGGEHGPRAGLNQEDLTELYDSLVEMEEPLWERMLSLIHDECRPEVNPEDAVEDLVILAKQDAPLAEMTQVLSAMLICMPTEEMLETLRELHDRIPRWSSLNMEKIQ